VKTVRAFFCRAGKMVLSVSFLFLILLCFTIPAEASPCEEAIPHLVFQGSLVATHAWHDENGNPVSPRFICAHNCFGASRYLGSVSSHSRYSGFQDGGDGAPACEITGFSSFSPQEGDNRLVIGYHGFELNPEKSSCTAGTRSSYRGDLSMNNLVYDGSLRISTEGSIALESTDVEWFTHAECGIETDFECSQPPSGPRLLLSNGNDTCRSQNSLPQLPPSYLEGTFTGPSGSPQLEEFLRYFPDGRFRIYFREDQHNGLMLEKDAVTHYNQWYNFTAMLTGVNFDPLQTITHFSPERLISIEPVTIFGQGFNLFDQSNPPSITLIRTGRGTERPAASVNIINNSELQFIPPEDLETGIYDIKVSYRGREIILSQSLMRVPLLNLVRVSPGSALENSLAEIDIGGSDFSSSVFYGENDLLISAGGVPVPAENITERRTGWVAFDLPEQVPPGVHDLTVCLLNQGYVEQSATINQALTVIGVDSFSPQRIVSGTRERITISGSHFYAFQNIKPFFKLVNQDNGNIIQVNANTIQIDSAGEISFLLPESITVGEYKLLMHRMVDGQYQQYTEVPGLLTIVPALSLESLSPGLVFSYSSTPMTLRGLSFHASPYYEECDLSITIGNVTLTSEQFSILDNETLTFNPPYGLAAGVHDLIANLSFEGQVEQSATLSGVLNVINVLDINPYRIPAGTSVPITVTGESLTACGDNPQITLFNLHLNSQLLSDDELTFILPDTLPPGRSPIRINGLAIPRGVPEIMVLSSLEISELTPASVIAGSGIELTLHGRGFPYSGYTQYGLSDFTLYLEQGGSTVATLDYNQISFNTPTNLTFTLPIALQAGQTYDARAVLSRAGVVEQEFVLQNALTVHSSLGGTADTPWPVYRQNQGRAGFAPYPGPMNSTEKWRYELGGEVGSPVLSQDGVIYTSDSGGSIYALTDRGASAEQLWQYTGSGPGCSGTLSAGGVLYIGTGNILYALNPQQGSLLWSFDAGGPLAQGVAIGGDGTIYVAASTGLYALYPQQQLPSGVSHRWKWTRNTGVLTASPLIGADGTIYVGSNNGTLYAYDNQGNLKPGWSTHFAAGDPITHTPALVDTPNGEKIFVPAGPYLYEVDADNGEGQRIYEHWDEITASPAATAEFIALPAKKKDPQNPTQYEYFIYLINRKYPANTRIYPIDEAVFSAPVISADHIIYFGGAEGSVFAVGYDPDTGDVGDMWNFSPEKGGINSSPALGPDGTLYIGGVSYLYALKEVISPEILTVNPSRLAVEAIPSTAVTVTGSGFQTWPQMPRAHLGTEEVIVTSGNSTDLNLLLPDNLAPGTYSLTVTNYDGTSAVLPDALELYSNTQPIAVAYDVQTFTDSSPAFLDGGDSYDPDGDSLSYLWRQISGSEVELKDPETVAPSFKTPEESGDLEFELIVSDGLTLSEPVFIRVMVRPRAGLKFSVSNPDSTTRSTRILKDGIEKWAGDIPPGGTVTEVLTLAGNMHHLLTLEWEANGITNTKEYLLNLTEGEQELAMKLDRKDSPDGPLFYLETSGESLGHQDLAKVDVRAKNISSQGLDFCLKYDSQAVYPAYWDFADYPGAMVYVDESNAEVSFFWEGGGGPGNGGGEVPGGDGNGDESGNPYDPYTPSYSLFLDDESELIGSIYFSPVEPIRPGPAELGFVSARYGSYMPFTGEMDWMETGVQDSCLQISGLILSCQPAEVDGQPALKVEALLQDRVGQPIPGARLVVTRVSVPGRLVNADGSPASSALYTSETGKAVLYFLGEQDGEVGMDWSLDGSGSNCATIKGNYQSPLSIDLGSDLTVLEGKNTSFIPVINGLEALDFLHWDFGDGTKLSPGPRQTSHAYADDGVYTLLLEVERAGEMVVSHSIQVYVYNDDPVITLPDGIEAGMGEEVEIACTISDPGTQDTHTVYWDFGDGNTAGPLEANVVKHTYNLPGLYPVSVLAMDKDGGRGTASTEVTVLGEIELPEAVIAAPSRVAAGETIILDGSSSTGSGELNYTWRQLSGPEVDLELSLPSVASFVAPESGGMLSFQMLVTDEMQNTCSAWVDIEVFSVEVSGPELLAQPEAGTTTTGQYTALFIDSNGLTKPQGLLNWSLTGEPEGCSINEQGLLTIMEAAAPGSFVVVAASAADPLLVGRRSVTLAEQPVVAIDLLPHHIYLASGERAEVTITTNPPDAVLFFGGQGVGTIVDIVYRETTAEGRIYEITGLSPDYAAVMVTASKEGYHSTWDVLGALVFAEPGLKVALELPGAKTSG